MNRQRKTRDTIQFRLQSVKKGCRRDIQVYRSEDLSWRIKCRRLMEHMYSFLLGVKLVMDNSGRGQNQEMGE